MQNSRIMRFTNKPISKIITHSLSPSVMRMLWVAPIVFGETVHQMGQLGTAGALSKRGWNIEFASMDGGDKSSSFMNEMGYNIHQFKVSEIPGLGGFSFNRSLRKGLPSIIMEGDFDVIMADWVGALAVNSILKEIGNNDFHPPPWLFEDRSPPANTTFLGLLQWLHYDRAWKKSAMGADGIEVLVPGLEKFVRGRFGDLPEIVHCPSGVDCDQFKPTQIELGDPIRIVYHGTLDKGRGLSRIIELGKKLTEINISVSITILGEGQEGSLMKSLSEKYEWLEFLGKVSFDDVPRIVAENDFGILPLPDKLPWRVGSPLKIMEFASSGLSVLATDVDGTIPFRNLPWIDLAPHNDPFESWIRYVLSAIEDKRNFRNTRIMAREYSQQNLTWDNAVSQLHQKLCSISGF